MARTIINLLGRKRTGKETTYKLIYSHVKAPEEFQFATPLKRFCIDVLGLKREQLYGSDADRESPTKYRWGWVAEHIRKKYNKSPEDVMTARHVIQVVGTDLLREGLYFNIWAEAGIREIVKSHATTCILTDGRFPNEVEASRNVAELDSQFNKVVAIRLYRSTGLTDEHPSETALDEMDAVPYQRDLRADYYPILLDKGYRQVTPQLWERASQQAYFDYLLDNNYTVDILQQQLTYILKRESICVEPSLS